MKRLPLPLALVLILTGFVWFHADIARSQQPPVGAGYWFAGLQSDGDPWKWRCPYPLEVQINWGGFSDENRLTIRSAFTHATQWSGHSIDFQGRTFDEPNQAEPGRIVVYERPFNDPPQPKATGFTDLYINDGTIRGAIIVLNSTYQAGWYPNLFKRTLWHEVGHVMGLAHYQSDDSTMASWEPLDYYDNGTRAGLNRVGGC